MKHAIQNQTLNGELTGIPSEWNYFDTPGKGPKDPQLDHWYWTIQPELEASCKPHGDTTWLPHSRYTKDSTWARGDLVRVTEYTPGRRMPMKGNCYKFYCEEIQFVFLFHFVPKRSSAIF